MTSADGAEAFAELDKFIIPEPQSESEKFFAKVSILLDHIENGEVSLVPCHYKSEWGVTEEGGFRIVVTPREVGELARTH